MDRYTELLLQLGSTDLSTTVRKVTFDSGSLVQVDQGINDATFRCKLVNGSTSNVLAYFIQPKGQGDPSFTADFATTAGSCILAGSVEFFNVKSNKEIYVVGSAASTKWNFTVEIE